MRKTLANLTREPLIHFVLIGASIYGLYGIFGQQEAADQERSIVITAGEIGWLEASWEKRWNRPPTPAERQGLIKQYTRETVLYREALAMGLDQDDTIIRRRLAQKLEFLSKDLIRPDPPGDKELQAYFEAHIDRYRPPDLLTMTQIFLDPDKRGARTLDDAESLKAELIALKVPTAASRDSGDPFMLQSYYPERSEAELGKLFGSEFAQSVFALEPAQWHGPVLSGYGVHLVYVHQRQEASPPTFSQVVERVRQDWEDDKGKELNEAFIARLLARYDVIIEDVAPGGAAASLEEKPQ